MHATASEIALRRVLAWLRCTDHLITPAIEQQVMQAMADVMAAGAPDLFGSCLERLGVSVSPAPAPDQGVMAPALRRGSIIYGEY